MMQWAIMGIIFKAVSWAMAFLFLARGASKFFFWNELAASSYMLVLNILGYHFFKLDGLGISFLLSYFLYAIQVYFIVRKKYEFRFSSEILKILIINILLISICFILQKNISEPYNYFVGVLIIFCSIIYSFVELDKRINLKEIMLLIKNKFTIK
ncbi:MAG: polysaccharide biosynthesis C-terminal domain-containing protein [Solirubrobacteraceae bacterium]